MIIEHVQPAGEDERVNAALMAFWGDDIRSEMAAKQARRESMTNAARPTMADDLIALRGAMRPNRGVELSERIRDMAKQGMSPTDMAWKTGASLSTVYEWLNKVRGTMSDSGVTT